MDLSKRIEEKQNRLKLLEQEYHMTMGRLKELQELQELQKEQEEKKEDE